MSTIDRPETQLVPGQRLDRATFHERYKTMPPGVRAELVGGVVYMPSPLGIEHGERDGEISDWLGHYRRFTKGVSRPLNATTQFGDYGEPQPDCQLRIPEELGGRSRIVDGFIVGPPELVVEVGKSSRRLDLGAKKADYERSGVLEYLVLTLDPDEIHWFIRRGGRFEALEVGSDGILRSEVFPGLWLDPAAFLAGDAERVFAVLDAGLATPEHAAFAARMTGRP